MEKFSNHRLYFSVSAPNHTFLHNSVTVRQKFTMANFSDFLSFMSRTPAEFPAQGRRHVLPSRPEFRGGHVQQRELRPGVWEVFGSAGRSCATEGLGEIPSSAGQQEWAKKTLARTPISRAHILFQSRYQEGIGVSFWRLNSSFDSPAAKFAPLVISPRVYLHYGTQPKIWLLCMTCFSRFFFAQLTPRGRIPSTPATRTMRLCSMCPPCCPTQPTIHNRYSWMSAKSVMTQITLWKKEAWGRVK